jgi:hypothetical protein
LDVPFTNIPTTQTIIDTSHVHHSKVFFSEKCIAWGVVQHIPTYELEEEGLGGRRMKCHESSV